MGNFKNKHEFKERVQHFKQLIKENHYFNDAVEKSKISISTANVLIKKEGLIVKRRNLGNCNDTFFNQIDSEEKAYLLGFILADGTIGKKDNRIAVNNAIDDEEILLKIQELICPNMKITYRKNPNKKDTCIIRWSSAEMKEALACYNIKPNKTYDFDFKLPFGKIPEELQRHFIRGFFDGDGCFIDGRVEFITTSISFALQIAQKFEDEFNCYTSMRQRKTKNVIEYMFYFHNKYKNRKLFLQKVYEWFYKDSTIFLNRKKKKFEMFLNTEVSSEITKGSETP